MPTIEVSSGPAPGRSTKAATTGACVKQARTAAKSALPKIDRKGGARRSERMISMISGSRLSGEIQNSPASTACACAGSKATAAVGVTTPRITNPRSASRIAGPDVQIIAPTCSWVVTPPTTDGTSTVVSEMGVILSPK